MADATIIDPISGGGSNQTAFLIAHSSVTIADLTIDGQTNTSSTDNFFYGVNTDDAVGSFNNTIIDNDSFENIYWGGVVLFTDHADVSSTTGNEVSGSSFDNIGTSSALGGSGYSILFLQSSGAITDNTITHAGANAIGTNFVTQWPSYAPTIAITGNHLSEFVATGFTDVGIYGSGLALDSQINNNTIDTTGDEQADDGIILTYLSNTRGTQLQVEGNTFTTDGDDVALTISHRSFGVSPANTPVLVSGNTFTETGTTGTGQDVAIQVSDTDNLGDGNDNTDATVTGNTITNYDNGIQVLDAEGFNVAASITGNTIMSAAGGTGILVSGAGASATIGDSTTGDSNTISGGATGILVSANASATISGNTGSIHANTVGIEISGGSATISGNHIYDNTTGILVTGGGSAAISSNSVYDNGTGIEFTAGGGGALSGNNFAFGSGSPATDNGTDLLIASTAGTVTIGDGNAFAGTTDYIQNLSSQNFNLSGYTTTTFSGFNAATTAVSSGNLASFYGVENEIVDALDNASYGYVKIAGGYDFVAQESELPADGGTAGAIQRAINVATSGDIVEVQAGTYAGGIQVSKAVTLLGEFRCQPHRRWLGFRRAVDHRAQRLGSRR